MVDNPTEVLSAFAAALTYDAIPTDVRNSTKLLILDALACAVAGNLGEETGQMQAMASALGSSEEASLIGGGRLSLAGATIMNGYLMTAVTMCDVHRPTLTHITPEVVPPALAIGERDDVSGRDFLTAVAAGCEVTTRIGVGLDFPAFRGKGWHGPGVIGPFGAAAAVGSLCGFDARAMARVELRDGRAFKARCEAPLGAPENPMSFGQVQDKFRTYAKPRYSDSQIEGVIDAVDQLDKLSSIRILVDLLREPARP